jgi:hypothetical protein
MSWLMALRERFSVWFIPFCIARAFSESYLRLIESDELSLQRHLKMR